MCGDDDGCVDGRAVMNYRMEVQCLSPQDAASLTSPDTPLAERLIHGAGSRAVINGHGGRSLAWRLAGGGAE